MSGAIDKSGIKDTVTVTRIRDGEATVVHGSQPSDEPNQIEPKEQPDE